MQRWCRVIVRHTEDQPWFLKQARCCRFRWEMEIGFRHFCSSGQMVVLHVNLCLCYMLSASLGTKLKVMRNHASQFFMQWPSPQDKGKTLRWQNGLHGWRKNEPKRGVSARVCPGRPEANETGNQKDICCKQAHTSDRPTSSLVLCICHFITVLQWLPLSKGGLCLRLSL